jgi:lysophospholipase-2
MFLLRLIFLILTFMASSTTTKLAAAAAMSTTATNTSCKKGGGPAALIFLHGLGDTPAGWSSLQFQLPKLKPNLSQLQYVFPAAPQTSITINGGMTMPGWFDLYDWPIAVGSKDDEKGIRSSVSMVEEQIQLVEQQHGIPRSRIVVGGFSQGGAIAIHAAYNNKHSDDDDDKTPPLAGCVCLSAWLTLPEQFQSLPTSSMKQTPLFWGHGEFDDKVLFPQQKFGVETLQAQGVKVESSSYPVAHWSHPDEIAAMADFLDKLLYNDDDAAAAGDE